jgi:hypothetical protein
VKDVRLAHDGRHAAEQALLLLRHLLHVVASPKVFRRRRGDVTPTPFDAAASEPAKACMAPGDRCDHRGNWSYCQRNAVAARHFDPLRQLIAA